MSGLAPPSLPSVEGGIKGGVIPIFERISCKPKKRFHPEPLEEWNGLPRSWFDVLSMSQGHSELDLPERSEVSKGVKALRGHNSTHQKDVGRAPRFSWQDQTSCSTPQSPLWTKGGSRRVQTQRSHLLPNPFQHTVEVEIDLRIPHPQELNPETLDLFLSVSVVFELLLCHVCLPINFDRQP